MRHVTVVDAQLDAYNARDIHAFMVCYSPDVVIEDAIGAILMRGHDQMMAEYKPFFESNPDLHADVVARLSIGEYVIDEESVQGISADPVRAVVAYRIRSGAIDHVRMYKT